MAKADRKVQKGKAGSSFVPFIVTGAVVLAAAFVIAVFVVPRSTKPQQRVEDDPTTPPADSRFQSWPTQARVEADSARVGLVYRKKKGGFGLQALSEIGPNRSVLSIPFASCVSVDTALDDRVLGPRLREVANVVADALETGPNNNLHDPHERMATFMLMSVLMRERHLGQASFWASWLNEVVPHSFDNDLAWSVAVSDNCLLERAKSAWERSQWTLSAMQKAVVAAWQRNSEFAAAIGVDAIRGDEMMRRMRWALTVIRTRGFPHKSNGGQIVVPISDLTDMRCNAHTSRANSPNSSEANIAVVVDDESNRVQFVTLRSIPKGRFLISSYSKRFNPVDAVRLYGFVDASFSTVPNYINFATLAKEAQKGTAEEAKVDAKCTAPHELYYNRTTARPSAALLECVERYAPKSEVSYTNFMRKHLGFVLEEVHSPGTAAACRYWAQKQSGQDRTCGIMISTLDSMLAETYTRIRDKL